MDSSDLLEYRRKGELFLNTARMTGFEYQGQDSEGLIVQWRRPSVLLTGIAIGPKSHSEFGITYQRRIARSTGELVQAADLVKAVCGAAFHNDWDYELKDTTTLFLNSRDGLTEANHAPAAERLAVLDKFMNMYLRELFL